MLGEWLRKPSSDLSVIFVHGILSTGEKCWLNANGAYWPALLNQDPDLATLGIYVYTYQTGFDSGSYSLSDVVDDLKERLFNLDEVAKNKKLIFVCHSMGGIVVRRLIVDREIDFIERQIELGLFLVASPSLGSKYANWLEPIAHFVGHKQAKALVFSQSNEWLNDLDKSFINLKENKRLTIKGKELLEDKFITLQIILKKQVVESFSGRGYFGESIKVQGSDHFSIAKPESNKSIQHRLLLKFISEINTGQREEYNNSSSPISDEDFLLEIRLKLADDLEKYGVLKDHIIQQCKPDLAADYKLNEYLIDQCVEGQFVEVILNLESAFVDSYDSMDENDNSALNKLYGFAEDILYKLVLFNIKNEWMMQFHKNGNDLNQHVFTFPEMSLGGVQLVSSRQSGTLPTLSAPDGLIVLGRRREIC